MHQFIRLPSPDSHSTAPLHSLTDCRRNSALASLSQRSEMVWGGDNCFVNRSSNRFGGCFLIKLSTESPSSMDISNVVGGAGTFKMQIQTFLSSNEQIFTNLIQTILTNRFVYSPIVILWGCGHSCGLRRTTSHLTCLTGGG